MRRPPALLSILTACALGAPASAGILDVLLPAPNKAEALDPQAYDRLTHLIVVSGETRYTPAQELILSHVEQGLAESGCWQLMDHAQARAKLPHAPLSAPNPKKWANSAEVSGKLLARMPKRDQRLGVLVLWVRDWRGNVYGRDNVDETVGRWLNKRLNPPNSQPARGEYERDVEAQLFDSETAAQIWRAHYSFPSGTPLENGRLPYADQDTRDAQISKEYDAFVRFFVENLRHPPNMENGCRERPENFRAAASPVRASASASAPPPLDAAAQALVDLKSAEPAVRAAAAQRLGQPDNEEAVAPLVAALADPDLKVRAHALDSLGLIGSAKAVDPLVARLSDPARFVRALAARSLGRIGSDRAKPALQKLLAAEKEDVVRKEAESALKTIDDPANVKPDFDTVIPGISP